jgi:hypothetical protein
MSDKRYYKKIRNTIIAGASSGIMAGMLLIGGVNTVYAETGSKINTVYMHKKAGENKREEVVAKVSTKKQNNKGWRKNA